MSYVVIGANYGDEGKGLMTDYLVRQSGSDLVTRFNGGTQAGHTVTVGGQRHVFGHVGAGTFAGARTYLSADFIVNPYLLEKERLSLVEKGLAPAIFVSPLARVSTIYDMAINAIAEMARGANRHGSCGLGINETVTRHDAGFKLTVRDIKSYSIGYLAELIRVIHLEWVPKRLKALGLDNVPSHFHLNTGEVLKVDDYVSAATHLSTGLMHVNLGEPTVRTPVVFEGAQGLALDELLGEFPHVTRSITGLPNALEAAAVLGLRELQPVYATRSYLTRHGAGRLLNEDVPFTTNDVVDTTNVDNPWQGSLRYAPLNLGQLRDFIIQDLRRSYPQADDLGIKLADPVIALTCLDQVAGDVTVIDTSGHPRTVPAESLPALVTREVGLPVRYISRGPTHADVTDLFGTGV